MLRTVPRPLQAGVTVSFRRELGRFDTTMVVVGGIIGAGIFINPYIVAQRLDSPALVLSAWLAGGVVALAGALTFAELGTLFPKAGGHYAYLREAYHPMAGFLIRLGPALHDRGRGDRGRRDHLRGIHAPTGGEARREPPDACRDRHHRGGSRELRRRETLQAAGAPVGIQLVRPTAGSTARRSARSPLRVPLGQQAPRG